MRDALIENFLKRASATHRNATKSNSNVTQHLAEHCDPTFRSKTFRMYYNLILVWSHVCPCFMCVFCDSFLCSVSLHLGHPGISLWW